MPSQGLRGKLPTMDTPGTQALPVVPLDGSAATFFAEARPPAEALTRRETDVLALLAQGRGNRSIADEKSWA